MTPRTKAQEILKTLQIDRPELLQHLIEICIERGAFVREAKLQGAEARLTVDGKRGIITVNSDSRYPARTRFSIAHELGHFELHRKAKLTLNCDHKDLGDFFGKEDAELREAEANDFASELLMPEKFIGPEIRNAIPSLGFIESLARRYQTSFQATLKRFLDLTPRACLVVFFQKDVIRNIWKSRFLEDKNFSMPKKLHRETLAFQSLQGQNLPRRKPPSPMKASPLSHWIKLPKRFGNAEILEGAKYFSKLDVGVALLWIQDEELIQRLES